MYAKSAVVKDVFNSEKMVKEESEKLVQKNQNKLQLEKSQFNKWAGKRYLVLITISHIEDIESFEFDRSNCGNMDDWLPVEDINNVKNELVPIYKRLLCPLSSLLLNFYP